MKDYISKHYLHIPSIVQRFNKIAKNMKQDSEALIPKKSFEYIINGGAQTESRVETKETQAPVTHEFSKNFISQLKRLHSLRIQLENVRRDYNHLLPDIKITDLSEEEKQTKMVHAVETNNQGITRNVVLRIKKNLFFNEEAHQRYKIDKQALKKMIKKEMPEKLVINEIILTQIFGRDIIHNLKEPLHPNIFKLQFESLDAIDVENHS